MTIILRTEERRSNPVAMLTGITGQDGSYLAEHLLRQGYTVVGIGRRSSVDNTQRIKPLKQAPNFQIIEGDVTDSSNVNSWFREFKPDEFYNLAAQSHVGTSFSQPELTFRVNADGVVNCLEAIRHYSPKTKFYQASTSEMFGRNVSMYYDIQGQMARYDGPPLDKNDSIYLNRYGDTCVTPEHDNDGIFQDEDTPFSPQSPYAIAKLAAHEACGVYRRAYGIHASCGILFNHESERRGEKFVTRKITRWLGQFYQWHQENPTDEMPMQMEHINLPDDWGKDFIHKGFTEDSPKFPKLRLGNLEAYRDWGHAEDYVRAMHLMLQRDEPGDYVVATGTTHNIEDFLAAAFRIGMGITDWKPLIVQDPRFMRPAEVDYLRADITKAKNNLDWEPEIDFERLVERMVIHDKTLAQAESQAILQH